MIYQYVYVLTYILWQSIDKDSEENSKLKTLWLKKKVILQKNRTVH